MTIKTFSLAAAALACAAALPAVAQKAGEPPITETTKASGGPVDADRDALRMIHADLAIEVLPGEHRLKGVATLTLALARPVERLLLDLDRNLPVSAVSVDGTPLAPSEWSNPEGRLAIRLPSRRRGEANRAVVRIAYGGTPHVAVRAPWDDGFVWSKTPGEQKPWVATTAQGYGCDLFWPCLDFPAGEPATVDLHITVPPGLQAPANGVLVGTDTLADGRVTFHWRAKSPNPYSVALTVGPYRELRATYASRFGNSFPIHYWYLPGREKQAEGLFAEFAPTLDFFETVIGPYPFGDEKMGVVETPHLGMEHQTINAYGNNYRKTPSGFDEIFQHELSHEWFGNQLTAADWDDFWLHEGYAQYMQPLYGQWREGAARYATMMDEQRRNIVNRAPLIAGRSMTSEGVYELEKGGPGQDIYYKGSWVLHTLRGLIGDKAFFDLTRRIVYGRPDPRPGNFRPRFATSAEFERIAGEVSGRDLRWFFDVYLRQAALPDLVARRSGTRLELAWQVPGGGPFPLPVEVQVGDRVERVAMTGGKGALDVPAVAQIVVDPDARVLRRSPAIEAMQRGRRGS